MRTGNTSPSCYEVISRRDCSGRGPRRSIGILHTHTGNPSVFFGPRGIAVDKDGRVLVSDTGNKRVQIFSPDGEFIGMWTDMSGPNHVARGNDGLFYIAEQKADAVPGFISIRDETGRILARWGSRHAHGICVDSCGNIYTGSTSNCTVDKYVRIR